ncbi:MAG: hypothetical protein R3181_07490, partial [Rubricoccaceae bacterium]|nr:hypothetical protein [Rubricoccaceae bacterium]
MKEKLPPALAKRLAAYSATAGVALACAPPADAQVVYHDLDPNGVVLVTNPPVIDVFPLDFDDDGSTDLQLRGCAETNYDLCGDPILGRAAEPSVSRYYFDRRIALHVPSGGDLMNGVYGYQSSFRDCVSRLSAGHEVGPAGPGQGFYTYAFAVTSAYKFGPYCTAFSGRKGYAGFRFVAADGELHYGWLRLHAGFSTNVATVFDFAYEATPDTPILAGAVSDALLSGDVNQTTFPPEGGTLAYTFTAENTADEPQPLDLWIEADGPEPLTLHLASGTLPPGAAVTRTVEVGVGDRV